MKKRIFLIALAAVMAASCSKKPDVPATAETTAAVQTEAAAEAAPEAETEAAENNETEAAPETEAAVTEAALAAGEKTNGKAIVTMDTPIIEGIRIGMTPDELKTALGEPEENMEIEDMHYMSYGENVFMFSREDGQDMALNIAVANSSCPAKLANGIEFGCSKQDVIDAFCCDTEDNTPDEMKDSGEKLLYGRDAFDKIDALDKGNLDDLKGIYDLGIVTTDNEMNGVEYLEFISDDKKAFYVVMFQFDDDDKLTEVSMVMTDDEDITDILGGGSDSDDSDSDDADADEGEDADDE